MHHSKSRSLLPIIKYTYFQKQPHSPETDLSNPEFRTTLNQTHYLISNLLKPFFTKPYHLYHYLTNNVKMSSKSVQWANYAVGLGHDMVRHYCLYHKRHGTLQKLSAINVARIHDNEQMQKWIKFYERDGYPTDQCEMAYQEWVRTTESGARYHHNHKLCVEVLSYLHRDYRLPKEPIRITRKGFQFTDWSITKQNG